MAIIRSLENANQLTDWSEEVNIIPNMWGLVSSLGLFTEKGISQVSFTFDENIKSLALMEDTVRGERKIYNKNETRKTHSIPVPHFTLDDGLDPSDIQGVVLDGSGRSATQLSVERTRILERIRRSYAATIEKARVETLKGNIYSPNLTVDVNLYTEFGLGAQNVVAINTTTDAKDIGKKTEEIIAYIQDNVQNGSMVTDFVAICSPSFFTNLISDPEVEDAYNFFNATNQVGGAQPLRDRLGSPLDVRGRQFNYRGVTFIEYRGSYGGVPLIEADTAYAFPLNVDGMFETIYAPANRFSYVNTVGMSQYVFEKMVDDVKWTYETETNFLNMCYRPQAITKVTLTV